MFYGMFPTFNPGGGLGVRAQKWYMLQLNPELVVHALGPLYRG